jgi:hypothetical protein
MGSASVEANSVPGCIIVHPWPPLTVPNQLGVAYNAHVLEAILTTVAPALSSR